MKSAIIALIVVDLLIIALTFLFGEEYWLINTQMAFIPSAFVMFGSMLSYRSMVQGRLNAGAIPDDERDILDKLEDPYELYDDSLKKDDSEKTLVEVVKEERQNLKKSRRSVWQITKDAKASFSFYRLASYLVLIFGFFYLNNNHILDIPVYLFSLAIPSIVIVVVLMKKS
ncbi:hypothetical protein MNB_SV-13-1330 [hydrothermal vent metagenome]|uniref:Uncharacterized protein n=1 Tax=hydrothermal vent metagenome TaxID=652676 RepID=A0A1W1CXU4_9ZZZZ